MPSFTFEGSFDLAHQWLPFAVNQQRKYAETRVFSGNLDPVSNVRIMIRGDHIHIIAGTTGYEFSIHRYAAPGGLDEDQLPTIDNRAYFIDDQLIEDSPYFGEEDYPLLGAITNKHINIWYGYEEYAVSGCVGARYGAGIGFSASNSYVAIEEHYPILSKSRIELRKGDEEVTAGALFQGYALVGITKTGTIHIWVEGRERVDLSVNIGEAEHIGEDPLGVYWVFNKAGNQCSGLAYVEIDADPSVARKVYLHTVTITVDEFGEFYASIQTTQVADTVLAVDYDYTLEANPLILCDMPTSDRGQYTHLPGYIGDPDVYDDVDEIWNGEEYVPSSDFGFFQMRADDILLNFIVDGVTVVSEPFIYNWRSGWYEAFGFEGLQPQQPLPIATIPDPTDVSFVGKLLSLDLRFRSYGISNFGLVLFPAYNQSPIPASGLSYKFVVNGEVVLESNEKSTIPSLSGVDVNDTPPYQQLRFMQPMGIKTPVIDQPVSCALFLRSSQSGFTEDIDFMIRNGEITLGYHKAKLDQLSPQGYSDLLITTYSSWV